MDSRLPLAPRALVPPPPIPAAKTEGRAPPAPPLFRSRRPEAILSGPAAIDALEAGAASFALGMMDLLTGDLDRAEGWTDLAVRLARRGYAVRTEGTRTVLVRASDGNDLCGTADLGHSHVALAERFGTAHPGWRRPARPARAA
ncbi:hypothetical protein BCF33_1725 [Hasllibacter halocynthiae]|uniref:Uncharacterized protein n=1 Tax=Hasllibacter halocynthiae TaxID=595589 RepID=A0A2T0X1N3_9RHOB|nr:hypothetical protein [Hasllibacter halocynthiae]PRY92863.1 hypothetical protein BCF33_1725 [Hasllibacter halocynthiae]